MCLLLPVSVTGAEPVLHSPLRVVDTAGEAARAKPAHLYVDRGVAWPRENFYYGELINGKLKTK